MNRAIIFPGGAGGNHLRWLLYLDKSIDGHLSIDDKMNFVLNDVYSNERSFSNWLSYEGKWRFSDKYESFIKILHEPKDDKPECKTILLSFDDYRIPLEHYSIFTSCFSGEEYYNNYYNFLKEFDEKIKEFTKDKFVLKTDIFFNEELDEVFYTTVVDYFKLENHYKESCILHKKWYECRKRVEREAYEFYTGKFWQSYLARINPDVRRNKKLLP